MCALIKFVFSKHCEEILLFRLEWLPCGQVPYPLVPPRKMFKDYFLVVSYYSSFRFTLATN